MVSPSWELGYCYRLVLDSCVYCIVPKPRVGLHVSTATVDEGIH